MANGTEPHTSPAMMEALHADGPFPEHADKLMLFGRLVGSWDIVGRFFDEHMTRRRNRAGILWALLSFSVWHRLYMEDSPAPRYAAAPA